MTRTRLIERFSGEDRRLLLEALRALWIVGRDEAVATFLAGNAELRELEPGEVLIRQGDGDNDIYFILAGTLRIFVNGREVAERGAGSHVGEMALVDPATPRTATNIAAEPTVVAKVSERAFSEIADANPRLWRSIAVELTRRLDQRRRFLRQPNAKSILFVGSSKESVPVAEALARSVPSNVATTRLWSQGVFGASHFPIEDLAAQIAVADFAVLVAAADDRVTSRGTDIDAPRDNVVFELGLFMGALSRQRTFLLAPQGVQLKIPTDLLGLNRLEYEPGAATPEEAVRSACDELVDAMNAMGPR